MNNNNSTKRVLVSVLGVALLVVAVVGVSFAFFTYTKQGSTVNTITTGTLVFKYNEPAAGINLTDAVPMSDADGIAQVATGSVFDFTVTSTVKGDINISYEISATETTDPAAATTLDAKYVKLRLASGTDGTTYGTTTLEPIHFSSLTNSTEVTTAFATKKLADGTVRGTEAGNGVTHYYRLQMWMAETDANGETTQMSSDLCTNDGTVSGTVVACDADGAKVATKGTNGKTFTLKVNVSAKDVSQ